VTIGGHDTVTAYRAARSLVGLVPQEITLEPFEKVISTVRFSRGLFGRAPNDAYLEKVLKSLSLWDKKDSKIMMLSGGMKRRVLIAKALAHEPHVLFLDEPSAGVDVELRKDMWKVVSQLKKDGVTIILTTHYIEEAEAIADRVGVIAKGKIILVENKADLMNRMGQKTLKIDLAEPVETIPKALSKYDLTIEDGGLLFAYDIATDRTGIAGLLADLRTAGLKLTDLQTRQLSLEEIFVSLVSEKDAAVEKEGVA
jgi:ABC-2 type transport system ATP-binding protein